ncbi:MAG: NAD-dependent epimerase/dehydratase family protein [bacterium]
MGKTAVIGGSGFVGSRLIEELGSGHCYNIDKRESKRFNDITTIQNICDSGLEKAIKPHTSEVVLLAAEHRDDVTPVSLYYDVNVEGTKNVLKTMDHLGIKRIIFTSSVAVYGLDKENPDETHPVDPFNDYGKSKWQAEVVLREWYNKKPNERTLVIIRPTVIFGEENRGNVYNLLKQIASGKFLRVGNGKNKKSMAYVGNVAAFLKYRVNNSDIGYTLYNYIDKPDYSMNELVDQVEKSLGKKVPQLKIPYSIGLLGGYSFDFIAKLTGKKLPISSVRIKKFCATTQFDATKAHSSVFNAPYHISEGLDRTILYEFSEKRNNDN